MPAIASLEDLKAVQKDLRSMVLGVFPLRLTPCASRLRVNPMPYALCATRVSVNSMRSARFCTPYASRLALYGKKGLDKISERKNK